MPDIINIHVWREKTAVFVTESHASSSSFFSRIFSSAPAPQASSSEVEMNHRKQHIAVSLLKEDGKTDYISFWPLSSIIEREQYGGCMHTLQQDVENIGREEDIILSINTEKMGDVLKSAQAYAACWTKRINFFENQITSHKTMNVPVTNSDHSSLLVYNLLLSAGIEFNNLLSVTPTFLFQELAANPLVSKDAGQVTIDRKIFFPEPPSLFLRHKEEKYSSLLLVYLQPYPKLAGCIECRTEGDTKKLVFAKALLEVDHTRYASRNDMPSNSKYKNTQ